MGCSKSLDSPPGFGESSSRQSPASTQQKIKINIQCLMLFLVLPYLAAENLLPMQLWEHAKVNALKKLRPGPQPYNYNYPQSQQNWNPNSMPNWLAGFWQRVFGSEPGLKRSLNLNHKHKHSYKSQQASKIKDKKPIRNWNALLNLNQEQVQVQEFNKSNNIFNNQNQKNKPLNILLLYADDWTAKTLGAAGNKVVKTPHLDQLAKEGILFKENCVTTSVCWASRATLFTGLYQSRHNCTKPVNFPIPWNATLYNMLRYGYGGLTNMNMKKEKLKKNKIKQKQKYYVGHVGKMGIWTRWDKRVVDFSRQYEGWHVKKIKTEERIPIAIQNVTSDPWEQGIRIPIGDQKHINHKAKKRHHDHQKQQFKLQAKEKWVHVTEKNEQDWIDFLKNRDKSKPFFLNTAFFATHAVDSDKRQYIPQNKTMDNMQFYNNPQFAVPIPKTATQEAWESLPDFFTEKEEGRRRWHWRYDEPQKYQMMMKNYYRMASEVDWWCGAIIAELKRQNVYEDTMVIFTTDNGNFHGEHGLWDKWYPHQESLKVPLIIKDPRMDFWKIGSVNEEDFTLNVDLAPTILGAAGIEVPESMMGRDISELYRPSAQRQNFNQIQNENDNQYQAQKSKNPGWRTDFFYEFIPSDQHKGRIHASEGLFRKDGYKYFVWPEYNNLEQLFNVKTDPYEEFDLIQQMKLRFNQKDNASLFQQQVSELDVFQDQQQQEKEQNTAADINIGVGRSLGQKLHSHSRRRRQELEHQHKQKQSKNQGQEKRHRDRHNPITTSYFTRTQSKQKQKLILTEQQSYLTLQTLKELRKRFQELRTDIHDLTKVITL